MFSLGLTTVTSVLLFAQASNVALTETWDNTSKPSDNIIKSAVTNNLATQIKGTRSADVKRRHAAWRNKRQGSALCPEGWTAHNSHCYLFFSQPAKWQDAKRQCNNHKACLVEVSNSDENNFLGKLVISDSGRIINNDPGQEQCYPSYCRRSRDCVWIGLTDRQTQDIYQWEGCGRSLAQWTNWGANEPNNRATVGSEDCVEMYVGRPFPWNDQDCHCTRGFICEKDPTVFISSASESSTSEKRDVTFVTTINATWEPQERAAQDCSLSFWNLRLNIVGVIIIVILVIVIVIAAAVVIVSCILRQTKISFTNESAKSTTDLRYLEVKDRCRA